MTLDDRFHQAMINIYYRAAKECNYQPTRFLGMLRRERGVATAKKLLAGVPQAGFRRLCECGRPDLTVETLVLKREFRELFTPEERAEAQRRLDSLIETPDAPAR